MSTTCLDCGVVIPRGPRCTEHARISARRHRNPIYDDPRWRRLRLRVLAEWRAQHGDV